MRNRIDRRRAYSVPSQYYLYAIIFLIFDVEAIFLVPFAVAFTGLPFGGFIAILIFLCSFSKAWSGLGARVVCIGSASALMVKTAKGGYILKTQIDLRT